MTNFIGKLNISIGFDKVGQICTQRPDSIKCLPGKTNNISIKTMIVYTFDIHSKVTSLLMVHVRDELVALMAVFTLKESDVSIVLQALFALTISTVFKTEQIVV